MATSSWSSLTSCEQKKARVSEALAIFVELATQQASSAAHVCVTYTLVMCIAQSRVEKYPQLTFRASQDHALQQQA
jgi:hypothetical protein